ncbi:MAG: ABC transporter permease, partial [Candidatus Marinimicrobia bacterium]|nr:ABC transporter permease [Candidatus Neomarinimicrobiota bacterium]
MISFFIRLWENILIAARALVQNKMRAILTTLGIVIGVLTVVSVASIIEGLNKGFASQIASIGSNTIYVQKYPWVAGMDWFKYRNRPNITMKDVKYVQEHMKNAEAIAPATSTRRNIKYRNNSLTAIGVSGVTMETEKIEGYNIDEGRYFAPLEIAKNKNSVVIGYEIKDKLFKNRYPIGEKIRIGTISYTV